MFDSSNALSRASRGMSLALNARSDGRSRPQLRLRVERLLGGDEPKGKGTKGQRGRGAKGKAGRDKNRPTEHGLDNNKIEATCALPAGSGRGPSVAMRASGCPFDRAHNVRDVRGALKAAAEGGKRLRPIKPAKFHAEARLLPADLMRTVKIRIRTERGVELRVVQVGPDSQTEYQHEYAERVANETGVNLFGGNLADAVYAAIARGGLERLEQKDQAVRRSSY